MYCNKVSFQELLDCFDNDLGNDLENNIDNLEHTAEKLQEILNRIMQRIMSIITNFRSSVNIHKILGKFVLKNKSPYCIYVPLFKVLLQIAWLHIYS